MTDRNLCRTSSNWTGRTPRTMSDAFGTAGTFSTPARRPRFAIPWRWFVRLIPAAVVGTLAGILAARFL
jgi:hypothetical protein